MRLKLHKLSSSFVKAFILSALNWSIFPIAHSAPLEVTQLTLTCNYEITTHNSQDYYTCTALNLVNNQQNAEITEINGKHMDGYDNSNVEALLIENQNVTYLPMKIFEAFENLTRFEVKNSLLREILKENFEKMDLRVLRIEGNLLDSISVDVFDGLTNLEEVDLTENQIESFGDELFSSNERIKVLSIDGNKVKELSPNFLKNLQDLRKFSAKNNEIEEIVEDLFENNSNLESIIFTNNSLSKISPKFTQKLENLKHFDFYGNPCLKDMTYVDETFYQTDQLEGLFESDCNKAEEDDNAQTEVGEDATTMPETTSEEPKSTDLPKTTTELSEKLETTDLPTVTATTSTDQPIETTESNQSQVIEELKDTVNNLLKKVEDLTKNLKSSNSSTQEGSENDQIKPPIIENLDVSTESQLNKTTKKSTTEVTTITEQQATIINSTTATQHDLKMSPEDGMVCKEWVTRNKSESLQPSIPESEVENTTPKGYVHNEKEILMIEGPKIENSTVEYEKIIKEKDTKISELEGKVKDLEEKAAKVTKLEAEVEELKAKNEMILKKMGETQKNLEDQLSNINKMSEKIKNLVEIDNKRTNYEDKTEEKSDIDQQTTSESPDTTKVSQSNSDNSTTLLTSTTEAQSNSSDQQESTLDILKSQITLLLTKIDKLTLQNSKKSSSLSSLSQSLKNCQDSKFSLELDLKLNSMDMQDRNKILESFKSELEACKNKTSELRTISRIYDACRESNSKYENLIVELQSFNRDLQGENITSLEKIKGLEMQHEVQTSKIEELKGENDDQKVKIEELEKQNGDQSEKIETLEKQNGDQSEKIEQLEKQNGDQSEKIEKLEKQNGDQSEKIKNIMQENGKINDLKQQTQTQATKIEKLMNAGNKLYTDFINQNKSLTSCKAQASNLKREAELLNIQSANLQRETNILKAQNANKSAEFSHCRQANQEFKKNYDDLYYKAKEFGTKMNSQLSSCHDSLSIYSSFPINCEVEIVEGESSCVARSLIAVYPNMHVVPVDRSHSNLKNLQIVNSHFRFFTNTIFEQFVDLKTLEIIKSELLYLNDQKIESNLLKNLRIEGNFIPQIPNEAFVGVPNLQNLILPENEIENIQDEAFKGLSNLRKLDLRENKISMLNVNVFYSLRSLTHLSLINNRLRDLPGGLLFYQRILQVVKFDSNPITYIGEELLDYSNELEKVYFDGTCVRGTYNGLDETKLRIKLYCQRKN